MCTELSNGSPAEPFNYGEDAFPWFLHFLGAKRTSASTRLPLSRAIGDRAQSDSACRCRSRGLLFDSGGRAERSPTLFLEQTAAPFETKRGKPKVQVGKRSAAEALKRLVPGVPPGVPPLAS